MDESSILEPIWTPDASTIQSANVSKFGNAVGHPEFADLYRWSTECPDAFWERVVDQLGIVFQTQPSQTLNLEQGVEQPRWLVGAEFNIIESCFQTPEDQVAVIASAPNGHCLELTYGQLQAQVQALAASVLAAGFQPGDRLAIVMPMDVHSVVIYLGIIYAGCTAVSIADSFAAPEIAKRLNISDAAGVFCCDKFLRGTKMIDVYSRVVEAGAKRVVLLPMDEAPALRASDTCFDNFLVAQDEGMGSPAIDSSDRTINVLFSSGTTGDPKAIPWSQTVPIKCASDGYFHHDIREGDTVCWPTNLGWMMGPWLIFATLINKATIGLFHDIPTVPAFGQFVQDAQVTMLGVVPTIVRAWRALKCMELFDWSAVRCFSSTGEVSHPSDMRYLSQLADGKPIIEYCGGTEIGGGYATSTMVQPNVASTFSTPALGSHFLILDDEGQPTNEGQLYLVPPAMGLSTTLLNRDHHATYFANCPPGPAGEVLRRHGDHFRQLENGYFQAGGRTDDTMNLGGIKVSSAEIETVLNSLDEVKETAAIAVPAAESGPDRLVVFYVPSTGDVDSAMLTNAMNVAIRQRLNPLFRVAAVEQRSTLPRTASNKIMRRELRREYVGG